MDSAKNLIGLKCDKCNVEIHVPADRVSIGEAYGQENVAYIGAGGVWSARHDGDLLLCPFHPGMRYLLRKM